MEKKYDILASGYVSMDRIVKIESPAQVGFTSTISNRTCAKINYGGCGLNIVQDISRLGMSAMPVIRVGDDYEEIGFRDFLQENHIPTDAVSCVHGELTPLCYLIQDREGQHITLFHAGAMAEQYTKSLPDEWFQQTRMAVMTVGARKDNEEFLYRCKKNDVPLALSMKCDMEAFPKEFLEELLHYCSIIFTNESERKAIEELYGCPITEYLIHGNAKVIVTTMGCDGSSCYTREGDEIHEVFVPICSCGDYKVVDTSGSGDAFVAGFLYGFLNGSSIGKCAMTGTVLSSFVIEQEGCCSNAPDLARLSERLQQFEEKYGKEF